MDERHLGSTFEDFLREAGTLEETTNRAIKRVLARQLRQLMDEQGLPKSEMPAACARAARRWIVSSTRTTTP